MIDTRNTFKSLDAQISDAQRQILNRQQTIDVGTARMIGNIRWQLTKPTTLMMAAGIGFIVGELSCCSSLKKSNIANQPQENDISPLKIALNLFITARTLYAALPMAWLIKCHHQSIAQNKPS